MNNGESFHPKMEAPFEAGILELLYLCVGCFPFVVVLLVKWLSANYPGRSGTQDCSKRVYVGAWGNEAQTFGLVANIRTDFWSALSTVSIFHCLLCSGMTYCKPEYHIYCGLSPRRCCFAFFWLD